jgi:hypothetical protein
MGGLLAQEGFKPTASGGVSYARLLSQRLQDECLIHQTAYEINLSRVSRQSTVLL